MLTIEQTGPKMWSLIYGEEGVNIKLQASSITNKFNIIMDFIRRLSELHGDTFDKWLIAFIKNCGNEETRASVVSKNVDIIKTYCDQYMDAIPIDYTKFVDESKAKKNSILFSAVEIKEIIRLSLYLKIYSLISNSDGVHLGKRLHKEIYNKFASHVLETKIASKIFDVVKTKTFRYNLTDRFMWDYIKSIQCKDIGSHIIEIFNFIMNNIIVLCEEDKNPITYFVGVIDESVKWFLRSVYKGTVVYDDEIATEDIHGMNINNLRTYSFNDTLGRLKSIAFEKIYEKIERDSILSMGDAASDDKSIIEFTNRLSTILFISPLCHCLVYPILSQMTQISYIHFKTISPEHAAILSYYTGRMLQKVFKSDYRNLFDLLDYYPLTSPSINTTYKIKAVHDFIKIQDQTQNFFGFNTKIPPHKMLCHFIGRVSRINFCQLLTGQKLSGIPLSKVEVDMVNFFTKFFAGEMKGKIVELTALMNADF